MKEILLGHGGGVKEEHKHPYGDVFLGEVPTSEFASGATVAYRAGITGGTAMNFSEPWLKFLTGEGKTLYIAKKPFRYSISWEQIHARGAVLGTRTVTINEQIYKVRLMTGAGSNPTSGNNVYDPATSVGSEWNRLFYPLIPNPKLRPPASGLSREGILFGSWASYTEIELGIGDSGILGRNSWCREEGRYGMRLFRGGANGILFFHSSNSLSDTTNAFGWRPVLELVE